MRIEKTVRLRKLGIVVLGALLLGLVLACSLFNQPPLAQLVASVGSGNSPLIVSFNASSSEDNDGDIISYVWNFDDGDTDTGPIVQHTFVTTDPVKIFRVTITVTDDDGASTTITQTIEVTFNADVATGTGSPTARFTVNKFIGIDPLTVVFDATGSTAGGGSIAAYNWNFGDGTTATGPNVTHLFDPDPDVTMTYPATLYVWNSNDQVDALQLDIVVIVPDNTTQDDPPIADIFVDDPDLIFESDRKPAIPSLFEVKLDPRGSSADGGHSLDYFAWDFGDGETRVETSDLEMTHIYKLSSPSKTFVVRLTIFDDSGQDNTFVANITLTEN